MQQRMFSSDKSISCYSPYLFSVHDKLFENNYSAPWYFFRRTVLITKVSQKGMRQHYFSLALVRAVLLDGYVRKSPPPLHLHA